MPKNRMRLDGENVFHRANLTFLAIKKAGVNRFRDGAETRPILLFPAD
ncbi:hypothetical protein WKI72_21640 [Candidatus Erwinia dacicola]|uniref:Uncharacterized protein n=1 Tax=Candidatus Erwinia dacicola TaxID=252393 RepID=A0A328TRG9_9GAMM|nr:hypothetical protein ACZ87_01154 [Candidatus Erwinia dacicola]